ncbi:ABC transporter ATP-binding protein [Nocardioides marmotae]|uniref:ABC transporter ATP-binding protein n=1 Tax=Nocardioides marmotae TaxID=2663857 RepID=UPI0012B62171|nr:ATP-binding cassette domain-containing protein [Nocardioides marmotae]MBC9731667.1 ATP-binding cassette domain-containing protein [Nocardioides marmotae]MTB82789.1 ATP-binding cassette domain-containing protein [Nocardioides marmotae]
MRAEPVVVASDLTRVHRSATGETYALRGVDLTVEAGTLTVVAGPSGSGKSSLLSLLSARERPSAGVLEVLGSDVAGASAGALRRLRHRRIGYVPQRASAGLFPHLTAADHVRQVAGWRRAGGESDGSGLGAEDVLAFVGLAGLADHRPATMSGGEQQRLAVAMALVGRPALLVADEPTAELDHRNADRVLDALAAVATAGSAVVVSSHDARVTERAERLLRLHDGVLSSETEGARETVAVIDSAGRLQLPPALLERFPSRRVVVETDGDHVRLRAPEERS